MRQLDDEPAAVREEDSSNHSLTRRHMRSLAATLWISLDNGHERSHQSGAHASTRSIMWSTIEHHIRVNVAAGEQASNQTNSSSNLLLFCCGSQLFNVLSLFNIL